MGANWTTASSQRVTRSLSAHSFIALALGGLIYILVVTGTLSVFNREIQRWEQPGAPEMAAITPEAAAKAAATVFASEATPTTHLYINFPLPDLPRTVITTDTQAFFANPDGSIAGKEHFPWTQFLLDLHYYLHLPHVLGLTVVGAMGAFLLALSVSGLLAHPRIFRDAFRLRTGEGILPQIDLHNRLSVWTLPFHFSNALTGALLGLASVLAVAIATVNFEGDMQEVFAPVFGDEPAANPAKAELANIDRPLKYMAEHFAELPPIWFILHDPGTEGQHTSIIAQHSDRLIFGDYYHFDAAGNYQGNVGMSDGTVAQQVFGSVYNVHFGNWGGLPVKLAYGIFGLALCWISASGLRIYFLRQRQKGRPAPKLEAAWEAIVWGVPWSLAITLAAAVIAGFEGAVLVFSFWSSLALQVALAALNGNARFIRCLLSTATALTLVLILAAHAWRNTEAIGLTSSLPVSMVLLLTALVFVGFGVQKITGGHRGKSPA